MVKLKNMSFASKKFLGTAVFFCIFVFLFFPNSKISAGSPPSLADPNGIRINCSVADCATDQKWPKKCCVCEGDGNSYDSFSICKGDNYNRKVGDICNPFTSLHRLCAQDENGEVFVTDSLCAPPDQITVNQDGSKICCRVWSKTACGTGKIKDCCELKESCAVYDKNGNGKCCSEKEIACGSEGNQICCSKGSTSCGGKEEKPECVPEAQVSILLDPEYILQTQNSRLFVPTMQELSPLDDIICRMKIPVSYQNSGQNLNNFEGQLVVDNGSQGGIVINKGVLSHVGASSDGKYNIFDWKIQGWTGSIDSKGLYRTGGSVSPLISNPNIKCKVQLSEQTQKISRVYSLTLCAHMWGNLSKKPSDTKGYEIISSVASGQVASVTPQNGAEQARQAVEKYAPFSENTYNFDYYANLKPISSQNFTSLSQKKQANFLYSSSCGLGNINVVFTPISTGALGHYSDRIVQADASRGKSHIKETIIHEIGHHFGLDDEYTLPLAGRLVGKFLLDGDTNCDSSAGMFSSSACDRFKKDFMPYTGGCYQGCSMSGWYRSSEKSIMGAHLTKFNQVSCAYIQSKINNCSLADGLAGCSAMDVIKK